MKVLRATTRLPPKLGGQEIHVAELTAALERSGIRQEIVYSEGHPFPGTPHRRIRSTNLIGNIAHDAIFGVGLVRVAHKQRFDVVHTHGDGPVARAGSLAASRSGAVHVHTVHGGLVRNPVKRAILRALFPPRSWYLAVSSAVRADLVRLGADPSRIKVRTSGIRAPFWRTPIDQLREGAAIGGRLVPGKGVAAFVEAWVDEGIDAPPLYVFGTGPEARRIEQIAAGREAVQWLGRLQAEGLAALFARTSVGLVLQRPIDASTGTEGTPTVGLELMASGCVPIADGEVGELSVLMEEAGVRVHGVDPLEPVAVAQLAARLAGPEHQTMRRRARAVVADGYTWEAVASDVVEWYQRALRARHGTTGPE